MQKQRGQTYTFDKIAYYSGIELREIGKEFGIGDSGVNQASRRIRRKAEKDRALKNGGKLIEEKLALSIVELWGQVCR